MSLSFNNVADSVLYSLKYNSLADLKMAVGEASQDLLPASEFETNFNDYVNETAELFANELRSHIDDLTGQALSKIQVTKSINSQFTPESLALYQLFNIDISSLIAESLPRLPLDFDSADSGFLS